MLIMQGRFPIPRATISAVILLLVSMGLVGVGPADLDGLSEEGDAMLETGSEFSRSIPFAEYLGPLAPVALSPFFGITMLSGAAYLSEWGYLHDNTFLTNSKTLLNPAVFFSFLLLTLFTSLPKLTKVSKPLAQAVDQLEAYAGIATIVVLQGVARMQLGEGGEAAGEAVVLQAGILAFTESTLIMAVSAVNIFVINTIKFLFEVLIWLSPVPAIDAAFEAALKTTCGALMALYVFSPVLAAGLNLVIFLLCLVLFGWAFRVGNFYRVVLFGPVTKGILRGIGLGREPALNSTRLPGSLRGAYSDPSCVLPVYPACKLPGFPKRGKAYLICRSDGAVHLVRPKWLGGFILYEIPDESKPLSVSRGILGNVIRRQGEGTPLKLIFSKSFNPCFDAVAEALGVQVEGRKESRDPQSWKQLGRTLRDAVQESGADFGLKMD